MNKKLKIKTALIGDCHYIGIHILQSKPIFPMVEPYTRYDRDYGKKSREMVFCYQNCSDLL